MISNKYIAIDQFCKLHEIESDFIYELEQINLLSITIYKGETCIRIDQVPTLEKMIRFHTDLKINPAGIDAIMNLLDKLGLYQEQLRQMQNQLNRFS